jgi:hypothetical protein
MPRSSAVRSVRSTSSRTYINDEAARHALSEALSGVPENWLLCRGIRHSWDVIQDFHVTAKEGRVVHEIQRTLECSRCETQRIEKFVVTRDGLDKTGQKYEYPEGYQFKGLGIMRGVKPQSMVLAEQFNRVMGAAATRARRAAS